MKNIEKQTIKHKDTIITIEKLKSGKNKIYVEQIKKKLFIPYNTCETSYDVNLIKKILNVKGPAYLCDEIMRDESSTYLQKSLEYSLLGYISKNLFKNKRILDFGCGSGSSTIIIARMFPDVQIVAIDLDSKSLDLAKLRAKHYGFKNIQFLLSPNANSLPPKIGNFDHIIISAVYEHLLPNERKILIPKIWEKLKPNGILFINRTPYRYFPIETHTTAGLPFINYLPDKISLWYAHNFSKKKLKKDNWETLLRKGIRGGTTKEIVNILKKEKNKIQVLEPTRLGLKDRVDLWYIGTNKNSNNLIKRFLFLLLKFLKITLGIVLVPTLSLAIKKR